MIKLRPEILLHPNIPKPMHGVNPRSVKGTKWWDEQRQIAYAKTEYCCAACGVHKTEAKYHHWLEAHELYDIQYWCGRMQFVEIVALCHSCHNYIHSGRMRALVDKGEMSQEKFNEIIKHGENVLAGVLQKTAVSYEVECKWADWCMVFDGVEYPPIYKTYEEWNAHYNAH